MSLVEAGMVTLQGLAEDAARAVRPALASTGPQEYLWFLNAMYHYTRDSGAKTLRAAEISPEADLKAYFEHMHREEVGHHLLAEADLRALGYEVDANVPIEVQALERYWSSIPADRHLAFVGAVAIFENIAPKVGAEVAAMIRRLQLTKQQCRWLMVHAEADRDHGAEALAIARRYMAVDPATIIAGAKEACALWIEIFRAAFRNPVALRRVERAAGGS